MADFYSLSLTALTLLSSLESNCEFSKRGILATRFVDVIRENNFIFKLYVVTMYVVDSLFMRES
jgi:hypothetical protein